VKKEASIEGLAQKNPAARPGFLASIYQRRRDQYLATTGTGRISVEFVAEAGLNLAFLQAAVGIEKRTGRQQCD
jgi:hypothetical protein